MTKPSNHQDLKTNIDIKSFKIIIVENDEGLGRLLQKSLKRKNFVIYLAKNGNEAISIVKGESNEILVVDYKMPDMTGKQLIENLIKKHKYTPNFITLIGYGDEDLAVKMMKLGSRDFINKNSNFVEVLVEVLKQVIVDVGNEIKLKKTESQLQKNTELLKKTGEMVKVGGWEIDLATDTVIWSYITKKIHEVAEDYVPTLEEAISFFPGESKTRMEKALDKAIREGIEYDMELQFVTAKGNKLWVHAIGKPEMKNGKCVRLCGTFQDITERKKTENELRIREAILKRTEQITRVGSWDWDVASDTVTWSDELFRIFRLNPENGAVSYADHHKIFTPESMQRLDKAVRHTLEAGEPYEIDLEIIRGDGTSAFCTARGLAKKDETGKTIKLYGSFQDITERKKKEEKLIALNQKIIASEQQLIANNQQLITLNQQLISSEQQLKASNQQLAANEKQLRAANQLLLANKKELVKTKETIERYLNISAEIIMALDKNGNITLLNESGHQMLGYRNRELIGKDWFETCLPEKKSKNIRKEFIKLMKDETEGLTNYQNQVITKSGNLKTIRWYNHVLKNDDGKITGSLSSGEDITERIKAEEALAASERKYRSIMDNSSSSVFIKNIDGKYLYINRKFEEMHEITNDEIQVLDDYDLFSEELADQFRKNDLKIIKTGKSVNFEEEVPWKGEMKTVLSTKFPLLDKHGKIYAICGIATDITDRKNAEREMQRAKKTVEISEERFRKSQEAGHIGSWEFNLETNEFWGSDEGKRIYNLDLNDKEFPAEEVMNIVVEKDREKVNQAMIDLVNDNKPYDIIFEIIPKNTSKRKIIRSIAELQKDETGRPVKVTGILLDITLQKTIEDKLIEAKEKAEEADQLKSAFLANMSHEIRTPMNGILGFTNLLQEPNLSGEEHQQFIEIIKKSGNRMLETVNALIDISRLETGQVEVSIDYVNVNEEVRSLHAFFLAEANEKGLELSIEKLLPENKSQIQTDKTKFNSILTNLIKNAIKYTDEGSVKINCEFKDDHFHCYVADTGIGVPKDRQTAIFNRFEQADIKDTRAFQGSGLGLAITKAYTELLGGKVGVKSEEHKGSVFWVKLPLNHNIT